MSASSMARAALPSSPALAVGAASPAVEESSDALLLRDALPFGASDSNTPGSPLLVGLVGFPLFDSHPTTLTSRQPSEIKNPDFRKVIGWLLRRAFRKDSAITRVAMLAYS